MTLVWEMPKYEGTPATEYLTLGPLQTRIDTHRRYSEQPEDVERAVFDVIDLDRDGSLLDVGCGTGSFLARLRREGHRGRLVGLDSSPAAIAALSEVDEVEAIRADAGALPFDGGAFDVVTARHMLYHVEEPIRAVREAARVLRPGGRFAATTNAFDALPETADLLRTVVSRHGVPEAATHVRITHTGTLPELIDSVFGDSETIVHANALVYPSPEPFARYCVAMLSFYGVDADHPGRDAVVADIVAEARRRVDARGGTLRDPKAFSVTVAHRRSA